MSFLRSPTVSSELGKGQDVVRREIDEFYLLALYADWRRGEGQVGLRGSSRRGTDLSARGDRLR